MICNFLQGLLVYVNYGTIDDFLYLTENLSLSLNERVCIARYGHNYRGDKVFFFKCQWLLSWLLYKWRRRSSDANLSFWCFNWMVQFLSGWKEKEGGSAHLTDHALREECLWKSLVGGLQWWGGREGGAILSNLWPLMVCTLSSVNGAFIHTSSLSLWWHWSSQSKHQ